jgi:hypothetical protein
MSRINSLSQSAIRAMFASETPEALILLVTITDPSNPTTPVRLADGYTNRIESLTTDTDVVYGVTSTINGGISRDYLFLPMQIALPGEEEAGSGQCSLILNFVTREAIDLIRTHLTSPVSVKIDIVLASSPNTVEASFSGFKITNVTYNADQIRFDLNMVSLSREPFPCFTFTPANFPGLF